MMPAWRLDARNRELHHFDVGASDGAVPEFVAHVVLCLVEQPQVVSRGSRLVSMMHMGPPLGATAGLIDVLCTAVVNAEGLEPSEKRQIKHFIDERVQERNAQRARLARVPRLQAYLAEYVINPPYLEPSAEVPLWRFSCAGFVMKAYEAARISLIEMATVPAIDLAALKNGYPRMAWLLEKEDVRKKLGLDDGGMWPAVLAGYVVNSLNRGADEVRRQPLVVSSGDEFFPSRALR
jgi:hypothetical protein